MKRAKIKYLGIWNSDFAQSFVESRRLKINEFFCIKAVFYWYIVFRFASFEAGEIRGLEELGRFSPREDSLRSSFPFSWATFDLIFFAILGAIIESWIVRED